MPALNIAPTKTNLIKEKERLNLALEGYDLLERKREILVMELMKRVEEVKILERSLEKRSASAYPALRRMLLATGRERVAQVADRVHADFGVRTRTVQIAGLSVPSLEADPPERRLCTSFMNSFADTDETMVEFTELLKLIASMAGLRSIVWRLAREVRKTQRRVNALEKIVIPESRSRGLFIEASLEEREREALFAVKLLKAKKLAEGAS